MTTAREWAHRANFGSASFSLGLLLLLLTYSPLAASEIPPLAPGVRMFPEVAFNRPSGFCPGSFDLTLSTVAPKATIYYTTNGDTPVPATAIRYAGAISVFTTTIVRATAFTQDVPVTPTATRTYLFVSDVLNQTAGMFPKTWGTNEGWPVPAHYTMADNIPPQLLAEALQAIPSLSVVTEAGNLFGVKSGIYTHPLERGGDWEHPAALELIAFPSRPGFHVNCGVRIHGGLSRRPEESPKHSFRLVFKPRYGIAQLHFPLFGPNGLQEFDGLVLRAGNNNSWLDSSSEGRRRADYLRDEWMRRSMSAMGHPSARGTFVHLYLNGVYWGVYNLCERPSAAWLAAQQARPAADYDFRKADEIEAGDSVAWNRLMALANSGVSDSQSYEAISQLLDLPELVDYLILNLYAGNLDWDRSANWYAARPRVAGGQFRFFVWDAERTLENLEADTTDFDDDESPPRLFQKLSENAEFRALFAARVQHLFFDSGPLTPEASAQRYRTLAAALGKAITAEAARWGTYRQKVHQYKAGPFESYTPEDYWQPEVDRILTAYFPQRRDIVLNQFRARGLFPLANVSK